MPNLSVLRVLLTALLDQKLAAIIPKLDMIMSDSVNDAACTQAGIENGDMQAAYFFSCAHISEIIRPGDIVLELACGPENQLCMIALLNPHPRFIKIDLSAAMLARIKEKIKKQKLNKVLLSQGVIYNLAMTPYRSVKVAFCILTLHPLSEADHLHQNFKEISRVLIKYGSLFLADLSRPKSEKSIEHYASHHADHQAELLTLNYLYSREATFSSNNFCNVTPHLVNYPCLKSALGTSFMAETKSDNRYEINILMQDQLISMRKSMTSKYLANLLNINLALKLGKLSSTLL